MYPFIPMLGLVIMLLVSGLALVSRVGRLEPGKDLLLDTMPLFCLGVTFVIGDHGDAMESLTRIVVSCLALAYITVDIWQTLRARRARPE